MISGTMLQSYTAYAINNVSEGVLMSGGTIPAGKRVVIGHIQDGWLLVTFQMGRNNELVGSAFVPPEIVERDAPSVGAGAPRRGMMPPMLGAAAAEYRPVSVRSRTSMQDERGMSWLTRPLRKKGFGAAGASEFTVKAAEELDDHLTTNGCAGCEDYKSQLRQLAFKFKAACLTDPVIEPQVSFNMSTPLSMTAYGSGTDKALSLVLGAKRTYDGGPCTDDAGNCLGNAQIAVSPVALGPLVEQVTSQVQSMLDAHAAEPVATQLARQAPLVEQLVGAVTGLLVALSAAIAKIPAPGPGPAPQPAPADKKESSGPSWGTVALWGIGGAILIGGGLYLAEKSRHA